MDSKTRYAADIHAVAWKSDPFARKRILHDMRHGHILASDVIEDAERLLTARGQAQSMADVKGLSA